MTHSGTHDIHITTEEIQHLADLARMELSSEEAENLKGDISSILGYVGQVKDVSSVAKSEGLPLLRNVMRGDEPQSVAREYTEDILKNAPHRDGDFVSVKKIL